MTVYCVSDEPRTALKVGFTDSSDPISRMKSLQTSNPFPLYLLHFRADMGRSDEEHIHNLLSDHRTGGGSEWFHFNPSISVVSRYMGFDVESCRPVKIQLNITEKKKKVHNKPIKPVPLPKLDGDFKYAVNKKRNIQPSKKLYDIRHWFLDAFCIEPEQNRLGISEPKLFDNWSQFHKKSFTDLINEYPYDISAARYHKITNDKKESLWREQPQYLPVNAIPANEHVIARLFSGGNMRTTNWSNAVASYFDSYVVRSRVHFIGAGDWYILDDDIIYIYNSDRPSSMITTTIEDVILAYKRTQGIVSAYSKRLVIMCISLATESILLQADSKTVREYREDLHIDACKTAKNIDELIDT